MKHAEENSCAAAWESMLQNRIHDRERKRELLLKGANINWKTISRTQTEEFQCHWQKSSEDFIRKLENGLPITGETIGSHCIHEDSAATSQSQYWLGSNIYAS